jgi:hypothetical protein
VRDMRRPAGLAHVLLAALVFGDTRVSRHTQRRDDGDCASRKKSFSYLNLQGAMALQLMVHIRKSCICQMTLTQTPKTGMGSTKWNRLPVLPAGTDGGVQRSVVSRERPSPRASIR